jgi:hypothetical protein
MPDALQEMRDKLLKAATPCSGSSPAVPKNSDPTRVKIAVFEKDEPVDLPIQDKKVDDTWTEFAAYLYCYGVVEEHFLGAPMPKFTGVAQADGKSGPYVSPIANVSCDQGDDEVVELRVANLHYLNMGAHSLSINCRAYDVSVFFLLKIIQAILTDVTTKGYSALITLPALMASAPQTVSTVETQINELIKSLSQETKIGNIQSLVEVQRQAWYRTIPQQTWIGYKFLEFERVKKSPPPPPPPAPPPPVEKDRFLVLWKFVLTTETEIAMTRTKRGQTGLA